MIRYVRKYIFLLILTDVLAVVPCFSLLNAAKENSIHAIDPDYNEEHDYKGSSEENRAIPQQFEALNALTPYLALSGIGIAIIGAFFLTSTGGSSNGGLMHKQAYSSKKLTAEVVVTGAQALSKLDTTQFNTLSKTTLTPQEAENFQRLITNQIYKNTFKINHSYPFAWITSANLNALIEHFSHEELNLLQQIIGKITPQTNTL